MKNSEQFEPRSSLSPPPRHQRLSLRPRLAWNRLSPTSPPNNQSSISMIKSRPLCYLLFKLVRVDSCSFIVPFPSAAALWSQFGNQTHSNVKKHTTAAKRHAKTRKDTLFFIGGEGVPACISPSC